MSDIIVRTPGRNKDMYTFSFKIRIASSVEAGTLCVLKLSNVPSISKKTALMSLVFGESFLVDS